MLTVITPTSVFLVAFAVWGLSGRDNFAAIDLDGNPDWIRSYAGRYVGEIQDMDIFFHNIGQSIDNAKKADIVVLGASVDLFGLDEDMLNAFGDKHKLRIFNMSFMGIRSGEFSREVVKRWDIHPKLWIINIDDQFVHFFSRSLDVSLGAPKPTPIEATQYERSRGYLVVAARNIRWRLEDLEAAVKSFLSGGRFELSPRSGFYRNVKDGSLSAKITYPKYFAKDNPPMPFDRDQNCHTTPEIIQIGKDYLESIGGRVVFILAPHSQYCPQQARELAQALDRQVILYPYKPPFTTIDGGGHMDEQSAQKYTDYVLKTLETTDAFKDAGFH
jgi:hypothetical protein